ncbi:MAG: peptidylprolyl isomerase [Bacteroidales bacterium]|nr:peptidylprolyl isomerase [Bacteroidales bacterium]
MNKYMKKSGAILLIMMCCALPLLAQNGLIDKVVAVVGGEMILNSDVETEVMMMRVQGVISDKNIKCEVFENLLLQKLLLAQARLDSLKAEDSEVDNHLDHRIRTILTQLGGEKATEAYFKKPLFKLKQDWREPIRELILTQRMQQKLMKDIPVAPSEVEQFYKKIPKDSLPIIPDQYVLRQIVINPPANDARFEAKEQLLSLRERIINGERFSTLAVMYSEDTESAKRGGELGLQSAEGYLPAFADAAMSLKPGQVSQIVETEYGYHIIQLIVKEGNDMFNARHILLKPKFSVDARQTAFARLDSIADLIRADSLTFEKAAYLHSDDSKSKLNGGIVVNEYTMTSRFDKDQLEPVDYMILRNMQVGEVSIPYEATDHTKNTVYKIILLESLMPSHIANIEDDYNIIQSMTKQSRQMSNLNKWIDNKIAYTYIRIDPLYKDCHFERKGWIK